MMHRDLLIDALIAFLCDSFGLSPSMKPYSLGSSSLAFKCLDSPENSFKLWVNFCASLPNSSYFFLSISRRYQVFVLSYANGILLPKFSSREIKIFCPATVTT